MFLVSASVQSARACACLLVEARAPEAHGFWQRFVALRGEALRTLGPFSWVILVCLFMLAVLIILRAAGRADVADL